VAREAQREECNHEKYQDFQPKNLYAAQYVVWQDISLSPVCSWMTGARFCTYCYDFDQEL